MRGGAGVHNPTNTNPVPDPGAAGLELELGNLEMEVWNAMQVVGKMRATIGPCGRETMGHIMEKVAEGIRYVNELWGVKEAWQEGMRVRPEGLPPEMADEDEAGLCRHNYDLSAWAGEKLARLGGRITVQRVDEVCRPEKVSPEDRTEFLRDRESLRTFAGPGVEVIEPEGYTPVTVPPDRLRKKYLQAYPAVHAMMAKEHAKGMSILIKKEVAQRLHLHYSVQSWAKKQKSALGRSASDTCYLNGPAASARCEEKWGPIRHPTIVEYVNLILDVVEREGGDKEAWKKIVIWKGDLAGAFTLLSFYPGHVYRLAFPLIDDWVWIPLVGLFGWTGMPFAFAVVSRMLRALIAFLIWGLLTIYVDDLLAVSCRAQVDADIQKAKGTVLALLGPHAWAEHKLERSDTNDDRCMVALGWSISPDEQTLTTSDQTLKKALGYMFSTNLKNKLSLAKIMRLASFAQRLSLVLPEMKIFSPNLYLPLHGRDNYNMAVEVELPADTVTAILMWRAALLLYYVKGHFKRPLMSLRVRRPEYLFEFDGSLIGWGGRMFTLGPMQEEQLVWTTSLAAAQEVVQRIRNHAHPSSFQNAMELIAFTLGLAILAAKGVRGITIWARGDSITALEWMTGQKYKAGRSRAGVILLLEICRRYDFQIHPQYTHITTVQNDAADRLSRLVERALGSTDGEVEFIQLPAPQYAVLAPLTAMCDPTQDLTHADAILDFWVKLRGHLDTSLPG